MPPSPEFVMPPEPPARQLAAPAPAPGPPEPERHPAAHLTAEPDEPIARPRVPWRQLTAAALVGILVGAGLPSVFQGVDGAAADARVESLRSTTMAYLDAIAAGESNAATAMVPVEADAETPPDAVLRSAQRIELPEVRLTQVEGDLATVQVHYRAGGRMISRSLDAEHVGGQWRLLTSLAEPVIAHSFDGTSGITVAGVDLPPTGRVLLYPGTYRTDRTTTPLIAMGGERFDVDGDPSTPTEVYSAMDVAPGMADVAEEVAIAHVRACDSGAECAIEAGADVEMVDEPWVESVDARGAVSMMVQLHSRDFSGQTRQLRMRAVVDEAGALVGWECGDISEQGFPGAMEPCRA
ncbi:hypothetical protein [Agrococcus citreus]|uniref:Uncharacterized protein n=1 Tax=Agrococcus citreus TaxID=84643 RepID=A0ABP4JPY5_9MICO